MGLGSSCVVARRAGAARARVVRVAEGGGPRKPTFAEVVAEHGAFIRRTLAQLGVGARDVDDVAQEVLRGVNRGLSGFDPSRSSAPESAVRGWLFGICERQAAGHRRAEKKRSEVVCSSEEAGGAAAEVGSAEDELLARERGGLLGALLSLLSPERRAVVVGYELEEVPMVELAAALGIPVNTAWNRLRLGRADLRAAWQRMVVRERAGCRVGC